MSRGNIKNHMRTEVKISVSGGKIIEKILSRGQKTKVVIRRWWTVIKL